MEVSVKLRDNLAPGKRIAPIDPPEGEPTGAGR